MSNHDDASHERKRKRKRKKCIFNKTVTKNVRIIILLISSNLRIHPILIIDRLRKMLRMNPIHDIVDVSTYSSFHCSRSNKEKNTDVKSGLITFSLRILFLLINRTCLEYIGYTADIPEYSFT